MNPYIVAAGVGAVGLLAFGGAQATAPLTGGDSSSGGPLSSSDDGGSPIDYPEDYMPDTSSGDETANLYSFKALLRVGESNDNYGALVGGGHFSDYSHHPGWTDASMTTKSAWEGWHGSHAAGAYQFQPGTFKEASDALGLSGAFTPDAQDAAADWDLKRRGAWDDVLAGNVDAAMYKLRDEWTSLGVKGRDWVVAMFEHNGGTVA